MKIDGTHSDGNIYLSGFPSQAYSILNDREIGEHGLNIRMRNRKRELRLVDKFLESDKKILLIYGPSGIGKSRLLFNMGLRVIQKGWQQIFWANVETIATDKRGHYCFDNISTERETLLLIDEPNNVEYLRLLIEQIKAGSLKQWKVIIAANSYDIPTLSMLRSSGLLYRAFKIKPLCSESSKLLALDLLRTGVSNQNSTMDLESVSAIVSRCDGFPVWIAVAVELFKKKTAINLNTLPVKHGFYRLAKDYIDNLLECHKYINVSSRSEMNSIVRWLSLYGEVSTYNDELMDFFSSIGLNEYVITGLERIGFLFVRKADGPYSTYEVKPNIIRDYVLREWLLLPFGESEIHSGETEELSGFIENGYMGKPLPMVDTVIHSVKNILWPNHAK